MSAEKKIEYWFHPQKVDGAEVRVLVGKHRNQEGVITRRVGGITGENGYVKLSNGESAKLHLKNVELI